MNLISSALRKPITVIVLVTGVLLADVVAVRTIHIDIFPNLDIPTIYVSQPYGGMSPQQMEGFVSTNYQNLFLYVSGIKTIQTSNVLGLSLLKLSFYDGTNMAQAAAEVTSLTTRAFAEMPPGTPPPIIMRFDASTLPVGQLTLSSPTRSNNELQDLASLWVRPGFSKIAGLSSPPPIGGNARTVVVKVDPALMRSHHLTPDQITTAINDNNHISPAGNIHIGNSTYLTPVNTVISAITDFGNIPLLYEDGATVYVKDVARVEDGADITTGYAYVNGRRSIYIPIIKNANASTWSVVQDLKKAIPSMKSLLPADVALTFEFDQSVYVIDSVKSLINEGVIGAVLTGLMVLLFLRDPRSAFIVVLNIPIAVLTSTLLLKSFGQTINIMTLGGLALAIGILVDESTVTIENIHRHQEIGKTKARAIADACHEIALPKLLILLSTLAVFAPAFLMTGVPKGMFLPLSMAVGFAMIPAFLLSQTLVPILANLILKERSSSSAKKTPAVADLLKDRFIRLLKKGMSHKMPVIGLYFLLTVAAVAGIASVLGKDILPDADNGQFQVRLRAPQGSRLEYTEASLLKAQNVLYQLIGKENVALTSAFAGQMPSSFPTLPIILFTSGSNEMVLQVSLRRGYKGNLEELEDRYREALHREMPELTLSYEPIDLTDKIMSQGASTPIEVAIMGKDLEEDQRYAQKLEAGLKQIPFLRDVQLKEQLKTPAVIIKINREKVKQMGLTLSDVSRSLTEATSSSRFTQKILWLDEANANSYYVQVEIPETDIRSIDDLAAIPLKPNSARPVLGDIATLDMDHVIGEYDRQGATRNLLIGANIFHTDLGSAAAAVERVLRETGAPPKGISVETRGLAKLLTQTLDSLQTGLFFTIIVLLLMLTANYQSFSLALTVITTIPAVLAGALAILLATGSTLNLQSYMGIIMSVGVSVSNAILLVSNAEAIRKTSGDAATAALTAAALRLRPILMTSISMVVGMIPMATGLGDGAQSAPLGRAVIGGLLASTLASLLVLPLIFAAVRRKASTKSSSLDPDDEQSRHFSKMKFSPFILLLAFLPGVSCDNIPARPAAAGNKDTPIVQTMTLRRGQLTTRLQLSGDLRPYQEVDLYAKVNSFVKEMYVDVGSTVSKGQLLARLDAPEFLDALNASEATVYEREALFKASKINYERVSRTSRIPGTIAPNDLDIAYAKMAADSANLQAAHSRLREAAALQGYLQVRAPFNGVVSATNIYPGAAAGPAGKGSSLPLLTLQEQSRLRLVIAVPEVATGFFHRGDTVHFTVDAMPGRLFTATISRLAGSLNSRLRTEQLEMDVDNTDKRLLPGMSASVMLDLTNGDKVFVVPQTAVAGNSDEIFVIRVSNGATEWVPVKKGREARGKIEIFGALYEGDQLAVTASDELKSGMRVRVTSQGSGL